MDTIFDEKTIQKRLAEGYGKGEFEYYKPWLDVRDSPSSQSRSNRPLGWKTKRTHQFLSDNEFNYFLYLEWADEVLDIREQFPLDRDDTRRIAEENKLRHPYMHDTYQVMTSDFFIVLRNGQNIVRTFKEAKDLENKNTIVKFSIEQLYWEELEIDWGIVTRNELDSVFVRNMSILHPFKDKFYDCAAWQNIVRYISEARRNVAEILSDTDDSFGLEAGTALSLYKGAVANKMILIDMFKPFSIDVGIEDITVVKDAKENSA